MAFNLKGFKNEEARIRADNYGHVIVSGERQTNDNKIIHFEQSFKVPQGCNIEDTSAILEGEVYYVTVPKNVNPEIEIPQVQNSTSVYEKLDETQSNVNNDKNDNYNQNNEESSQEEEAEEEEEEDDDDDDEEKFRSTNSADEWSESSLLDKISKNLKKNRCILLTAILAFSLGVVVSHRYKPKSQVERSQ